MDMDLNNRLTEDETLEQAYDIFLELAADNLDPADIILFNLQFEERGGAELFDPSADWEEHVDYDLNPDFFAEVVIGLADTDGGEINDIFARVLLCREKDHKLWFSRQAFLCRQLTSARHDRRHGRNGRYRHGRPADTADTGAAVVDDSGRWSYAW